MSKVIKSVKLETVNKTINEGPATIEVETKPADPIEMVDNVLVSAVSVKSEDMVKTHGQKPKVVSKKKPKAKKPAKGKSVPAVVVEQKNDPIVAEAKKETPTTSEKQVVEKAVKSSNTLTNSQIWWNEIKDRKLGLFGLHPHTVEYYCKYVPLDPNRLFMTYDVSAVVPALETVVGPEFELELISKYIVLTKIMM